MAKKTLNPRDEQLAIIDAYAKKGIEAMGGKDLGFYVPDKGWVSLRTARKDTGINMAKSRGPRMESLPWGDYATVAMLSKKRNPISRGWDAATETYRQKVLEESKVPGAAEHAKALWKDLTAAVKKVITGKRNSFDTPREKAAFAAGITAGGTRLGAALTKLRSKRVTRLERMTRRGLGRSNPPLTKADVEAGRIYYVKQIDNDAGVIRFHGPKTVEDASKSAENFSKSGFGAQIIRTSDPALAAVRRRRGNPRNWEKMPCRRCGKPTEYNFCSAKCVKENNKDMAKGSYASPEQMREEKAMRGNPRFKMCEVCLGRKATHIRKHAADVCDKCFAVERCQVRELKKQSGRGNRRKNINEIAQAAKLHEKFVGAPTEKITEIEEPARVRDDYADLGWMEQLVFHPPSDKAPLDLPGISKLYDRLIQANGDPVKAWREVSRKAGAEFLVFDVEGDEIRLAASADGKQLYLLGGRQDKFTESLEAFGSGADHDRVDLGELVSITYAARKAQAGDKEPHPYYHIFGEEGGKAPRAFFDTINSRIGLSGGSYHLKEADRGIIN